jgi:Ca2+-binding EF-hand superfamily protein
MTKAQTWRSALLAGIAITVLAGTAFAQGFMPWSDILKKAMADHPGMTMEMMHDFATREKQFTGFEPWMISHFKEVDADHDGSITMAEMHAWMDAHKMSDKQLTDAWYEPARK